MPRSSTHLGLALTAVLALSAPLVPAAHAQSDVDATVAPVDATGRAPTSMAVRIVGKSVVAVRGEVRGAARTVCLNAVDNGDMGPLDYTGCREATQKAAMSDYRAILRAHPEIASASALAGEFAISIASR